MYKLLIHPGDIYISCVVNRSNKSECYYEGIGTVGEILSTDDVMFYAKIENYRRFENRVSLALPDGKFVEHLGRENTSLNPFTSSRTVRLLKNDAYDYILAAGGRQFPTAYPSISDCTKLEDQLKNSIRAYFVGQTAASVFHIEQLSRNLGKAIAVSTIDIPENDFFFYKPSSATQTSHQSILEIEKELQHTQSCLETEKQRRKSLETELARYLEDAENFKTALSQAEVRYHQLILQQQQDETQLRCLQESLRLMEAQRDALQAAVDESAERIAVLEQAHNALLLQYEEENRCRQKAEAELLEKEALLRDTEQLRIAENNSSAEKLAALNDQLETIILQRNALQSAVDDLTVRITALEHAYATLSQQYEDEKIRRQESEATLGKKEDALRETEQLRLAEGESNASQIATLRGQLEATEAQLESLKLERDTQISRIKELSQAYEKTAQQLDAEISLRAYLEAELAELKKQLITMTTTHTDEGQQHRGEISRLERKVRALEQQNERLSQDLRISEYKVRGLCRHCGSEFTGFLRKKCSGCGRVKDY